MTILTIKRLGHPVLRQRAAPADLPLSAPLHQLALDMVDTMLAARGVGLAAPQIGVSVRLIAYHVPHSRISGAPDDLPQPVRVLVNPLLEPLDDEVEFGAEGCLSIPDLRGIVPRYRRVAYRAHDLDGQAVAGVATGFHARVLQHEVDHLDGIVYLDRMSDLATLGYLDALGDLDGAPGRAMSESDLVVDSSKPALPIMGETDD